MAQQVLVQLVDDLDGTASEDVETVVFGLDGVTYEIDLSDTNAERLRASLAEFVEPARRVGGRLKRGTKASSSGAGSSGEAGLIRAWALENGYELSNRGRISGHVVEAYKQAQGEARKAKTAPKQTSGGSASARGGRRGARTRKS